MVVVVCVMIVALCITRVKKWKVSSGKSGKVMLCNSDLCSDFSSSIMYMEAD